MSGKLTSDPTAILLDHNHWATRELLNACQSLSHEQFHQKFEMGLGSLHDTIRHIIGAMGGWTDLLAKREFRPRPEAGAEQTPQQLIDLLDKAAADLAQHVNGHPLDEHFIRERGGSEYTFTRGAVMTHVTTHGMHHRAQCLNMLRHLGVDPLPELSVTNWTFVVDACRAMA